MKLLNVAASVLVVVSFSLPGAAKDDPAHGEHGKADHGPAKPKADDHGKHDDHAPAKKADDHGKAAHDDHAPAKKADDHGKAGDDHAPAKKADDHGKAGDDHGKADAHGAEKDAHDAKADDHGKADGHGKESAAAGAAPMPSGDEALALLVAGNADFASGKAAHPRQDSRRLLLTAGAERPFVTVLSCSDSRVMPEVIFDQGVGDAYVVRVSGNIAGHEQIASLEYGVDHLGTPLVVVLGHTKCGFVASVCKGTAAHGHSKDLVSHIKPAVDATKKKLPSLAADEIVPEAIRANVVTSMGDVIKGSASIRKRLKDGKVRVVGGVYNIESGKVEWLGAHPEELKMIQLGDALPPPHGGDHGGGHGDHGGHDGAPGGEPGAPGAEPGAPAAPAAPPQLPLAFAAVALLGTMAGAVSMMLFKREA
jgi:carbonic anhydrase